MASLGAGVQPRSTVQLFMPVCAVEKRPSSQFFLGFGFHWRLFIFISRESKWGTLKSAGNPRCAVPAERHSICTDRRRPGPAAALQVSPTSDTCQSVAILMNRPLWRGKAFRDQRCQFLTRNKSLSSENESNCSMTSECVRTDSILSRGAASSTVDVNSRFSRFQFSVFWSDGLASSVFIFSPILLRFFYCLRLCKGYNTLLQIC